MSSSGNVYVADTGKHCIQKFTSTGIFVTKWGQSGPGGGGGDGQLRGPYGVAVSSSGNVYVADTENCRIQKFTGDGTFITKWGSKGTGDGQFDYPTGVSLDASDNVYVADADIAYIPDTDNDRIQKFTSDGTFLTKWGAYGSGDGQFDYPADIAVNASGSVYVTDSDNHRIQMFDLLQGTLSWVGTTGYVSDGVSPDAGAPNDTTLTFKVKYTDPTGAGAPTKARCSIQCKRDGAWKLYKRLNMSQESGDPETGAVYAVSTKLTNWSWRYTFRFSDAGGKAVKRGKPCERWWRGPTIISKPKVSWTGNTGYESDGVNPGSGAAGTEFRFEVRYQDSAGDRPRVAHEVLLKKDGTFWRKRTMARQPGGDYRNGTVYERKITINAAGSYEYKFRFADSSGTAAGDPARWQSGPTVTGTSGVTLASVAATPTGRGGAGDVLAVD